MLSAFVKKKYNSPYSNEILFVYNAKIPDWIFKMMAKSFSILMW